MKQLQQGKIKPQQKKEKKTKNKKTGAGTCQKESTITKYKELNKIRQVKDLLGKIKI